jgi:hypothetical protein
VLGLLCYFTIRWQILKAIETGWLSVHSSYRLSQHKPAPSG